jgi:Holliday junction resolvasome RuvABC endonuclease subunit
MAVVVTDYGVVRLSKETLKAYDIPNIKTRSKRMRERIKRMERNVCAMAEHQWVLGKQLKFA